MVFSWDARKDVDAELLTKRIIYRCRSNSKADLAYDTYKENYHDYTIMVQCTIQRLDSKYVSEGILKEGDLVLFMRFEYDKDANNKPINPVLKPKKADKIYFLDKWFVIKSTLPLTGEDDGLIGWDCTAGQTDE